MKAWPKTVVTVGTWFVKRYCYYCKHELDLEDVVYSDCCPWCASSRFVNMLRYAEKKARWRTTRTYYPRWQFWKPTMVHRKLEFLEDRLTPAEAESTTEKT